MYNKLLQYELDGSLTWQADLTAVPGISYSAWGRMVSSTNGFVYQADYGNDQIFVYSMDGNYIHSIPTGRNLYTICIDSTNQWLLVGNIDCSPCDVDMYDTNGTYIRSVLQVPGDIFSLAMYSDRLLAVGLYRGLYLYNLNALL